MKGDSICNLVLAVILGLFQFGKSKDTFGGLFGEIVEQIITSQSSLFTQLYTFFIKKYVLKPTQAASDSQL